MYVPEHFRLPDTYLDAVLREVHVGNLVTVHADGPRATLVPFILEERDDERVLVTHLVRNNPQAREPITGPGMVIIDIADAYVSPSWYATNEALPNVPTWDYLTVHATGEVRFDMSAEGALRNAVALTARSGEHEVVPSVGEARLRKMSRAIVGVEVVAERLEGKAKMSQNRHPDDIRSLLEAFEQQGEQEMAKYLRDVSLPYAQARFALMEETRASRRGPRPDPSGPAGEGTR